MNDKHKKFVNIPHNNGWLNVELLKERGLIPYFMYKNYGFDSYMAGAKIDNYTYIDSYLNGLKMEFFETGSQEEKINYIKNNAHEIDVLMLDSLFNLNPDLVTTYKKLNPKGRIYLPLDANSGWMDRIEWDNEPMRKVMNNCDVIATSCLAMQKYLNEKWPWPIYHIPNGYFSINGKTPPPFEQKHNTIMTCARIQMHPKSSHVLLEAFAAIHDQIPDWDVVLVGNIDNDFKPYINSYFDKYPQLKNRVTFKGVITDKELLQQEYFNAKIFALPSAYEGGCPNVVPEALFSGCAMAITKIDAWEECIDNGRCGKACTIGNIKEFTDILLSLAKSKDLKSMCERSHKYALEHFNVEKLTDKLYELLFNGERSVTGRG